MGYGKTNIAGGGLRIKSFQHGETVLDYSKDITINAVDISKSIIIIEIEKRDLKYAKFWCGAKFVNPTQILIYPGSGYDVTPRPTVHWYVYELAGFKSLQSVTGEINRANANERVTTIKIPIQAVDLSKTLIFRTVWLDDRSDKYASVGFGFFPEPQSTSSNICTNLALTSYDANSINVSVQAYVVELR